MEGILENYIKSYVDKCKPSEYEIVEGKKQMQNIFRLFQTSRKYSLDRERLAGSTAKKTAISGHLDFDCVVFVNPQDQRGYRVKIPEVLENFEEILITNEKFDLEVKDFKKTPKKNPTTLMFTINNIDFDISVALNQINPYRNHHNPSHEQMQGTFHSNIIDKKEKSVSLVEMNIEFAKEKSAFAHEVARLAKFWNKTIILELLTTESYVSGRSSIMELIAFAAAEEEERHARNKLSHSNAFRKFLVRVRDIETLKISHEKFWRENGIPYTSAYKPQPYLFDPSNPANNFLEGMKPAIRAKFSLCASTTLARLKLYEMGGINNIFEMYPSWHGNEFARWEPKNWLIGTTTTSSAFVDLKYNKGAADNHQHSGRVKWLEKYLIPIVKRSVIESTHKEKKASTVSAHLDGKDVQENIEKSIGKEIKGEEIKWSPTNEGFESRMVTITIPYNDGANNAIRISFN